MISKPSQAWKMLGRMMDTLMPELSDEDVDDLHCKVQRERNKRLLESRRRALHEDGEGRR